MNRFPYLFLPLFLAFGNIPSAVALEEQSTFSQNEDEDETQFSRRPLGKRLGSDLEPNPGLLGLVPLLRVESVRKELKLDEEQSTVVEELSISIREDLGLEILSLLRSLRNDRPEDRDSSRKRIKQVRDRINQRIQSVLTDQQFQRLNQLGLQLDLRRAGAAETLTSHELAAALDLSEEQITLLRQQALDSQTAKTDGKSRTLQQARSETRDILTQDQQKKLDTLLGAEFDLPEAMLKQGTKRRLGGRRAFEGRRNRAQRGSAMEESTESVPDRTT